MGCECGVITDDNRLCDDCLQEKRDKFHADLDLPLDTKWPPYK